MQIIIRILGAGIPVFDFVAGEIAEGQFKVFDNLKDCVIRKLPAIAEYVTFDTLLGTQAYIASANLGKVVRLVANHPHFADMQFYPNFVVFTLNDDEPTKEKDA